MTRVDIINALLGKNPHLLRKDAEVIFDTIFATIKKTLIGGGKVELRRFGIFEIRRRKERAIFNHKIGKVDMIKAKKVPFFKMSRSLMQEKENR